jgi:hypothetical protein
VHLARDRTFGTRPSNRLYVRAVTSKSFFETNKFLHSANLQATIQAAGFLRVPPKSPFKKLLLGTGLWRHTYVKMSTNLKSLDTLKDADRKKGQLSQRLPILYVPVVDVVTPKEEPQVLKVKLPDNSHISVLIFSRGNNEEYIAHIVAVLRIMEQKGLPKKCRVFAKAVAKQQEGLKNLLEAAGLQDTVRRLLTLRPARWRLSRLNRCSKRPRRLTTRQSPSCMSS